MNKTEEYMNKTKLKVNDPVKVLVGKYKGKVSNIMSFSKDRTKILVEGVNVRKKAIKPSQVNPKGGFTDVHHYIHISNVAYCAEEGISKISYSFDKGEKVRNLKKINKVLG